MTQAQTMPQRWAALWNSLHLVGDTDTVYRELTEQYEEPSRHYHNLEHIEECLIEFDTVRSLFTSPEAAELALWFHDVIYDTHAKDNEEQSAQFLLTLAPKIRIPSEMADRAAQLILATKHTDAPFSGDAQLIVDIDLSILGKTSERFDRYERAIREEYAWVDLAAFQSGRLGVLKMFAERKHLYSTPEFQEKYEERARQNLARSIATLSH